MNDRTDQLGEHLYKMYIGPPGAPIFYTGMPEGGSITLWQRLRGSLWVSLADPLNDCLRDAYVSA